MHCNMCQRLSSTRLPLNCPACARDVLYQSRLLLAHTLLEQETASIQTEQTLKESGIYDSDALSRTTSIGHNNQGSLLLESILAQNDASEERAREMLDYAKGLHAEVSKIRDEVTSRRASNGKRRSELTAARQKLAQQEALEVAPIVKGIGALLARSAPSSSSNSASASRSLITGQNSRPRPLHLRKPLSLLAKDDPHTYAGVVEGTTLLAWDIAWLCKSQGINVGDKSWEDICNIGQNLWGLVAADPAEVVSSAPSHDRQTKQGLNANPQHAAPAAPKDYRQNTLKSPRTIFGYWSHDAVHSNLTSAAGSEHMRGWRLQDPSKVIDRVKHMLLSDRTGAGWEILEGKEWETASTNPEQATSAPTVDASAVILDRSAGSGDAHQDPKISPVTPNSDVSQDKLKGTSGWTKLKSR
ncbi:MAG: hypothetical protein Q9208_005951 [Pyrenodesmia sp. 3 TL-2023]